MVCGSAISATIGVNGRSCHERVLQLMQIGALEYVTTLVSWKNKVNSPARWYHNSHGEDLNGKYRCKGD